MKKNVLLFKKKIISFLLLPVFLFLSISASAEKPHSGESDSLAIQDSWDITVTMNGKTYPSWLEIRHSGLRMLVGRFVGTGGSARPISKIYLENGKMSFSIPPQWENDPNDLKVEGTYRATVFQER